LLFARRRVHGPKFHYRNQITNGNYPSRIIFVAQYWWKTNDDLTAAIDLGKIAACTAMRILASRLHQPLVVAYIEVDHIRCEACKPHQRVAFSQP
jgi:hypothetical protein